MTQQKKSRLTQWQKSNRVRPLRLSSPLFFCISLLVHFASAQQTTHGQNLTDTQNFTQNQEPAYSLQTDTFLTSPKIYRYQPTPSAYEFSTSLEKKPQAYNSFSSKQAKKRLEDSKEEHSESDNFLIKSLQDGEIKFHTEIGNHWHMDHGISFKKGKHQHRDNRLELDFHYDF